MVTAPSDRGIHLHRRTRVDIRLDGQELRSRAMSLVIANGRFTGPALELAPEASLDDGRFDVLLFEGFGGLELVTHLARAIRGRPFDPRVRRYRAARVLIATRRPLPVRLDSVDLGTTRVELIGELEDRHDQEDEDRHDEGELKQRLARLALRARPRLRSPPPA